MKALILTSIIILNTIELIAMDSNLTPAITITLITAYLIIKQNHKPNLKHDTLSKIIEHLKQNK